MKGFFSALLMIAMFMFTACDCGCGSNNKASNIDSLAIVDESIVANDTVQVSVDTIHCVAITKTGEQCKNHRIKGDTLCSIHRKLNK